MSRPIGRLVLRELTDAERWRLAPLVTFPDLRPMILGRLVAIAADEANAVTAVPYARSHEAGVADLADLDPRSFIP